MTGDPRRQHICKECHLAVEEEIREREYKLLRRNSYIYLDVVETLSHGSRR